MLAANVLCIKIYNILIIDIFKNFLDPLRAIKALPVFIYNCKIRKRRNYGYEGIYKIQR